ncbi:hypothetical protein ACJX0J_025051, partial [Zea mays]
YAPVVQEGDDISFLGQDLCRVKIQNFIYIQIFLQITNIKTFIKITKYIIFTRNINGQKLILKKIDLFVTIKKIIPLFDTKDYFGTSFSKVIPFNTNFLKALQALYSLDIDFDLIAICPTSSPDIENLFTKKENDK